jgi:hypothetical protein
MFPVCVGVETFCAFPDRTLYLAVLVQYKPLKKNEGPRR